MTSAQAQDSATIRYFVGGSKHMCNSVIKDSHTGRVIGLLEACVVMENAERVAEELRALHDIAPDSIWGKDVCAWAAQEIQQLRNTLAALRLSTAPIMAEFTAGRGSISEEHYDAWMKAFSDTEIHLRSVSHGKAAGDATSDGREQSRAGSEEQSRPAQDEGRCANPRCRGTCAACLGTETATESPSPTAITVKGCVHGCVPPCRMCEEHNAMSRQLSELRGVLFDILADYAYSLPPEMIERSERAIAMGVSFDPGPGF